MSTKTSPSKADDSRPASAPLALIAGPTASGKSALAIELAEAFQKQGREAVIINADSMQVYVEIPILSAAPPDIDGQPVVHLLYGSWEGSKACSAAEWAARARAEIADVHADGKVPILVGGTGMYLKVLLEGIAPIPEIDPEVRAVVRAMDTPTAYAALQIEDPLRASELEPGDSQRIARALEVKRSTGVTLGDWQQAKTGGLGDEVALYPLVLMPERQRVYDRCETRFAEMLENGAIQEVERLLEHGYSPELPVMRAIGVPEISAHLRGEITREECIATGAQATRQYAKRQFTWLRNQCPQDWPRVESQNIDIGEIFAPLLQD